MGGNDEECLGRDQSWNDRAALIGPRSAAQDFLRLFTDGDVEQISMETLKKS